MIAPVAVNALVNGNDIVDLIDAVDVQSLAGGSDVPRRPHVATTASATITTSFPFTSAATIRGPITPTTT